MKNLIGLLFLVVGLMTVGCGDEATGSPDGAVPPGGPTTHVVSSEDGNLSFLPADIVIAAGDMVRFEMTSTHNAVEVSQDTYENGGVDALEGGFNVGFGDTETITFDTPGLYYYVCQPHVPAGMIGTITVQ